MEIGVDATDRETVTNTFMQAYMQKFVEERDLTDIETTIREAITMHQQVRSPSG